MQVRIFQFNMLAESTYVLADSNSDIAVVVDPGAFSEKERKCLDEYIDSLSVKDVVVLLTHSHLDHIFGVAHLVDRYKARVYAHKLEEQYMFMNSHLCDSWRIPEPDSFEVTDYIKGGDELTFGDLRVLVLDVPGHSAGGLAYYLPDEKMVFTGDALFAGSMGRTDFPGGGEAQLWDSLRNQLMRLPDDTQVLPGHGLDTTIGRERGWVLGRSF
ncbi:MAG: MBL fold metallo-hydrolase [Bacteroidia bacterium]|nr:MBL fold metallo-hydrolase [Bacteroidia bacterium]